MILGGGNTYSTLAGSGRSATALTDLIDLRDPNPHWVPGPDLPRGVLDDGSLQARGRGSLVSAVALPDGRVLETGGSMHMRADDVHEASIFDPATNTFTPVNADPVGRDYHSEALLLPGRAESWHSGRTPATDWCPDARLGVRAAVPLPRAAPGALEASTAPRTRSRPAAAHDPDHPMGVRQLPRRLQCKLVGADRLGDADPPGGRHALLRPQPARRPPCR